MIQSAALLSARVSARINDDYPELPTGLLEILRPEYLRPFPSCSIACFAGSAAIEKLARPLTVRRGTQLNTRTDNYRFRTVYDVDFGPIRIADARYAPATSAPANVRLPEETTGILSMKFAGLSAAMLSSSSVPERVRLFVGGNRRTVAATIDTVLLRTSNAFVEVDENGAWIAFDPVPISAPGFEPDDALTEKCDGRESLYRVLLEYFSLPEKFDFIEVDLLALLHIAGKCHSVTLHLPIGSVHRDSHLAQILQTISAANFTLFCTPVINLFAVPSEPITLDGTESPAYPIVPSELGRSDASVYRVDEVRLMVETHKGAIATKIEPYLSLSHHRQPSDTGMFWLFERDKMLAEDATEHDMLLSFVDSNGQPCHPAGTQSNIDLTCSNGKLPASLGVQNAEGDFVYENEAQTGRVSLLHPPTQSIERPHARDQLWDMVAMLSAGPLSLCQAGLPAFKQLLSAHAPLHSGSAKRHIDSLRHLSRECALEWVSADPQPMMMRGMRVRIAVDEACLCDCSMSTFARVLESIFLHYAPTNSFVQLIFVSAQNGAELVRGRALPGALDLL